MLVMEPRVGFFMDSHSLIDRIVESYRSRGIDPDRQKLSELCDVSPAVCAAYKLAHDEQQQRRLIGVPWVRSEPAKNLRWDDEQKERAVAIAEAVFPDARMTLAPGIDRYSHRMFFRLIAFAKHSESTVALAAAGKLLFDRIRALSATWPTYVKPVKPAPQKPKPKPTAKPKASAKGHVGLKSFRKGTK